MLVDALPARGLIPSATRARPSSSTGVEDDAARRRPQRPGASRRSHDRPAARRPQALRKEFGGLVAVNDVDFTIPRGSIVSLIGPNGAGKTTFFNMLTGVYKPTAGASSSTATTSTGKPPHAITERGIARTFQNIRLFAEMTALENVLVGMHSRLQAAGSSGAILRTPGLRREEREARERARELLALLRPAGRSEDELRAATCPTATSAGSRSRARWRPSRSCCCSTSRPPA